MKPVRMLLAAALLCAGHAFAHGGLADISVFDRIEGRRLQVYWHDGRAYVAGKPGNEYRITLRNRMREDLLAVVSADGVNIITGQTADPSQSGYVLSPHASMDLQGWRKSLSVGVIGVALFRRKQTPPPAPISEAERPLRRDSTAEAQLGTGHGRHETSQAYYTSFDRATSAPAEIITLYYDSHANLVARGIRRAAAGGAATVPGFCSGPTGVNWS